MANCIPKFEYEHSTLGTTTITLELPPEGDPQNRRKRTNGRETRSNRGSAQYQLNYTDETFTLNLIFLTQDLTDQLEELYEEVGKFGKSFKYFESEDEPEFVTVEIPGARKTFDPRKVIRSGTGFIHDLRMSLRKSL